MQRLIKPPYPDPTADEQAIIDLWGSKNYSIMKIAIKLKTGIPTVIKCLQKFGKWYVNV